MCEQVGLSDEFSEGGLLLVECKYIITFTESTKLVRVIKYYIEKVRNVRRTELVSKQGY